MKNNPLLLILAIAAAFFSIFLLITVVVLFSLSSGQIPKKKFFAKSNRIGVIEISGIVSGSKRYLEEIENFEEDEAIRGVIVRLNSPGGAVGPSQEIYNALRDLSKKKPVYASMASVAASGAYYIACGTKKVFANPGTITGSIGVIMPFADLSGLFQWAKVKPYSIKTGKFKDIGSISREMSSEEKQLLEGMLANVLNQFRQAIVTARGLTMEQVVLVSDGRIYTGEQAKEAHLIDELGGLNEAVDTMAKELKISDKPRLIYAAKRKKFIERFFESGDEFDYEGDTKLISLIPSVLKHLSQKSEFNGGAFYLMPYQSN